MRKYKLIKKFFGPKNPGEAHKVYDVGTIITTDDAGLPPKQDYADEIQGDKSKPADPAAVKAAQKRVAEARVALKKADKDGTPDDVTKAQAALDEAKAAAEAVGAGATED